VQGTIRSVIKVFSPNDAQLNSLTTILNFH